LILRLINTPAYLFTEDFIVVNIYGSFINNTCKLKYLLKGVEYCKDTQMKASNITQTACQAIDYGTTWLKAASKLLAVLSNTPQLS